MKKYLLIGLPVLLIVLGLFVWLYVRSTPQYSLYLISNSVKAHDYKTFTKYVDINTVVSNVIDNALAESAKEEAKAPQGDQWYQLGQAFAQGLITAMKPTLIQKAKDEVQKEVETGTFKNNYSSTNLVVQFFAIKVKQDGKVANVTIPANNPKNQPLTVKMRQTNGYWQIFDMALDTSNLNNTSAGAAATSGSTQAKYDSRVSIGSDWYIRISTPEAYTTYDEFSGPKEGNKYVDIEVTYENTTKQQDSFSTDNLKIKDIDDHSYSSTYSGRDPMLASGTLEANGKVKGYLTYEMPSNEAVKSVIYSNSYNGTTIIFGN